MTTAKRILAVVWPLLVALAILALAAVLNAFGLACGGWAT